MRRLKIFIFLVCFLWKASAWGLEIYLKNGDKISGVVISQDAQSMMVQTLAAGEIKIDKSFIDFSKTYPQQYSPSKIQVAQANAAPAVIWKKDFSLGYTQEGGNTNSQLGQLSTTINRKTNTNESTFKLTGNYSSSDGVMNGKKFYGLLRYAYSFGDNLKWYNFYKVEGNQDYFADIYYRVTPATGVGYWFSDTDNLKAMTELGIGYQYTAYRIETTPDNGQPVLTPRFFIDKRLIGNLHISEDLTVYPSLEDFNDYLVRSETSLVNQITQRWSLKLSYTNDYNNDPPPGFKKEDDTWVTSLEYHF